MALTANQKQALRTWLEANVSKATSTVYYRIGVKTELGKPVYGDTMHFDELTGEDIPGTEYRGRTFTKGSLVQLDFDEVVRRTVQKAKKQGLNPDHQTVFDFLLPYMSSLLLWSGATSWGSSYLSTAEIDAIDPDA